MTEYKIKIHEACSFLNLNRKTVLKYIKEKLLSPKLVRDKRGVSEYRFTRKDLTSFKKKRLEQKKTKVQEPKVMVRQEKKNGKEDLKEKKKKTETEAGETSKELSITAEKIEETIPKETEKKKDDSKNKSKAVKKIKKEAEIAPKDKREEEAVPTKEMADRRNIVGLLKENIVTLSQQLEKKDKHLENQDRQINELCQEIDNSLVRILEQNKEEGLLLGSDIISSLSFERKVGEEKAKNKAKKEDKKKIKLFVPKEQTKKAEETKKTEKPKKKEEKKEKPRVLHKDFLENPLFGKAMKETETRSPREGKKKGRGRMLGKIRDVWNKIK